MENKRVKFPQHIYIDLSAQNAAIYEKEENKSSLISKLLEEYYDSSIVKVKIDEKIKDAYNNDIFKEFRIPMILLEFYMKGNTGSINNEMYISSPNPTKNIEEEVTLRASSENNNNTEELTVTKEQKIVEEITDIKKQDIIDDTASKIDNDNTISKVFVVNDEESSKLNEATEHISSDNKNDIKEENNNSVELTSTIINNKENNNHELVKDISEKIQDNKTNTKVVESVTPRSGSITDLLKGNNKSIL